MKLTLQHRHQHPSQAFPALITTEFESRRAQLHMDEARVLVERQREASPPFRISAHPVTPGPDVRAEAKDHTPRAALGKLWRAIGDKIRHRARRRNHCLRSQISGRALPTPA